MKTAIELQRAIQDELLWHPTIQAAEIGVAVRGGVATLTGRVPGEEERHTVERAALGVPGVRGVANGLDVELPTAVEGSNTRLAEAAVHALEQDEQVPAQRVQVVVRYGWITLEGCVEEQGQKRAAEDALRCLEGVRGVTNRLVVQPWVTRKEPRGGIVAVRVEG